MVTTMEYKNVSRFKLTITKDASRIKIPVAATKEDQDKILPFLNHLAENIKTTKTLRGSYSKEDDTIRLHTDNNKETTVCKYSDYLKTK